MLLRNEADSVLSLATHSELCSANKQWPMTVESGTSRYIPTRRARRLSRSLCCSSSAASFARTISCAQLPHNTACCSEGAHRELHLELAFLLLELFAQRFDLLRDLVQSHQAQSVCFITSRRRQHVQGVGREAERRAQREERRADGCESRVNAQK